MSELEFDFMHRAGIKHKASDALSWLSTDGEDLTRLEDEVPAFIIVSARDGDDDIFLERFMEEYFSNYSPAYPDVLVLVG